MKSVILKEIIAFLEFRSLSLCCCTVYLNDAVFVMAQSIHAYDCQLHPVLG